MGSRSKSRVENGHSVLEHLDRNTADSSLSEDQKISSSTYSHVPTRNKVNISDPVISKIQGWIDMAKHELKVDVYRGIFTDYDGNSYYTACFGQLDNSKVTTLNGQLHLFQKEDAVAKNENETTLDDVCNHNYQCPSLQAWYQAEVHKQGAKRQRAKKTKRKSNTSLNIRASTRKSKSLGVDDTTETISILSESTSHSDEKQQEQEQDEMLTEEPILKVRRDPDLSYRCKCDFNPLCLASLGGAVDDYLYYNRMNQSGTNCHLDKCSSPPDDLSNDKGAIMQSHPASDESTDIIDIDDLEFDKIRPHKVYDDQNIEFRNTLIQKFGETSEIIPTNIYTDTATDYRLHVLIKNSLILNHLKKYNIRKMQGYETALNNIQIRHQSLFYSHESNQRDMDPEFSYYCIPAGLRNLGATCYLNSQFQCLVMNEAFLEGVFSWGQPASKSGDDRMNQALHHLQIVLARMIEGPDRVVCTNEFSMALGLETNEMQDPNEFTRLLFDRMHESFQTLDESFSVGSMRLKDLLPSIFGGTFVYETKCKDCGGISERLEDFMDLTLPIVDEKSCGEIDSRKSSKGATKVCNKATVQICLDNYLEPEILDGDNKYHCSACNAKCDAERNVSLKKLPPVLNIQLARYVYDRKSNGKKKLMDKVLLPKCLRVPTRGNAKKKKIEDYILCAIQSHIGTSAHGGHFICEAMNWPTGLWWSFDDDKVALLERPTNSFDSVDDKGVPEIDTTVKGSSDAYNLFYVQKSFLSEQASKAIAGFELSTPNSSIVKEISMERVKAFETESKNQKQRQKTLERLHRRRLGILGSMFESPRTSCNSSKIENEPKIWVDGNILRRFMSCSDPMDDFFRQESCLELQRQHFVCKHKEGLHPRVSRKGKLLSKQRYKEFISLLRGERCMIMSDLSKDDKVAWGPRIDSIIISNKNLKCNMCETEYKSELCSKIIKVETILNLHIALDPKQDFAYDDTDDNHPVLYAVSKNWITNFRKNATNILKQMTRGSFKESNVEEGLDSVDIKYLQNILASFSTEIDSENNDTDTVDPCVNTKITCIHRNCNMWGNQKSVRTVSSSTWKLIKHLFPNAIEHSRQSYGLNAFLGCRECQDEKVKKEKLTDMFLSWANDTLNRLEKHVITETSEVEDNNYSQSYYFVHKDDLQSWHHSIKYITNNCPTKKGREETVGEQIKRRLFEDFFEELPDKSIKRRMRSLICKNHNRTISSIVPVLQVLWSDPSQSTPHDENEIAYRPKNHNSSSYVELLPSTRYEIYSSSMILLEQLLLNTFHKQSIKFDNYDTYHPKLNVVWPEGSSSTSYANFLKDPNDINSMILDIHKSDGGKVEIYPDLCCDEQCMQLFCSSKSFVESAPKSISIDESSTISHFPVKVVQDNSDVNFEVYEFTDVDDFESASKALDQIQREIHDLQFSSRRRSERQLNIKSSKSTFQITMKKTENVARMRLQIYERSTIKMISSQRLAIYVRNKSSIGSNVTPNSKSSPDNQEEEYQPSRFIEIDMDANEREIEDLLTDLNSTEGENIAFPISLILLQGDDNILLGKRKRKSSRTDNDSDEAILELLLHVSDISNTPTTKSDKNNKRRKERGFRGTFLQSMHTASCDDNDDEKTDEDDEKQTQVTSPSGKYDKNEKEFEKMIQDLECNVTDSSVDDDILNFNKSPQEKSITSPRSTLEKKDITMTPSCHVGNSQNEPISICLDDDDDDDDAYAFGNDKSSTNNTSTHHNLKSPNRTFLSHPHLKGSEPEAVSILDDDTIDDV